MGEDAGDEVYADAAAFGGVGDVEGGEVGAAPVEVEEVGDVVEAEAVEEVAGDSAAEEAEGDAVDAAGGEELAAEQDEGYQHGEGEGGEGEVLAAEHAPGGAGVADVGEVEKAGDDGVGFEQGECAADPLFCGLVEQDDADGYQQGGHARRRGAGLVGLVGAGGVVGGHAQGRGAFEGAVFGAAAFGGVLAGEAFAGEGEGFEAGAFDGVVAGLADAVGAVVNALDGEFDVVDGFLAAGDEVEGEFAVEVVGAVVGHVGGVEADVAGGVGGGAFEVVGGEGVQVFLHALELVLEQFAVDGEFFFGEGFVA